MIFAKMCGWGSTVKNERSTYISFSIFFSASLMPFVNDWSLSISARCSKRELYKVSLKDFFYITIIASML